jgi:hypothetical protein
VPAGWKAIKDANANCQIAIPPEWVPLGENNGAAVFHNSTTAIAVVTRQPGQEFKLLGAIMLKSLRIRKEKMFENSAARILYQHKTSNNPDDTSTFSAGVPAKNGTCSCHVMVLPVYSRGFSEEDRAQRLPRSVDLIIR